MVVTPNGSALPRTGLPCSQRARWRRRARRSSLRFVSSELLDRARRSSPVRPFVVAPVGSAAVTRRCRSWTSPGIAAVTPALTVRPNAPKVTMWASECLARLSCDSGSVVGRRDSAVLTALAMCVGRQVVSADQLADAVWGDGAPPTSSHKALQGCVVRLRKALGAESIETSAQGYRLVVPADDVDSQTLRADGRHGAASCWRWASPSAPPTSWPRRSSSVAGPRRSRTSTSWDLAVDRGRPGWTELRLEAEELRRRGRLRTGRHLEVLAEAEAHGQGGADARTALGPAGPGPVPGGPTDRGAAHDPSAQVTARGASSGSTPVRSWQRSRRRSCGRTTAARHRGLAADQWRVSLPRPERRTTSTTRSPSSVATTTSRPASTCWTAASVAGRRGSVRQRQVVAGAGRRRCRAAPRRPPVVVITPGEHPDAVARGVSDRRAPVGAPGRPVRGGLLAVRATRTSGRRSSRRSSSGPSASRWCVAHAGGPVGRGLGLSRLRPPGGARPVPAGRDERAGPAGRRRGARAAGGPADRAGLVDLLVGEVEGDTGALPMLSHALRGDVEATRGQHPDRGRLRRHRRHPRSGRAVRRGGLLERRPRAAAACCATCCCGW